MEYISTRGQAPRLSFEEVVLAGLALDGGLYVPASIPTLTPAELTRLQALNYTDLAYEIISRFTAETFSEKELRDIIEKTYASFRHTAIAPLKQIDTQQYILELFHGPTLAFKDFALQFLGHVLDSILLRRNMRALIVGATSGDTGSAAIAGCSGRENIDIFILFPEGRVSEVQRRQMTTIADANVHAIALKGNFDNCQDIVKALFNDITFREAHSLVAVNSINWARVLAQVVYYFYAALRLGAPARQVSFSVPTGNFGDIYAGYIAKKMGLPIDRLIIATNRNDILTRCLNTGVYGMQGVSPSLSPSMDIEVSSNFERLLFDLHNRNGAKIMEMMQGLRTQKSLSLGQEEHAKFKAEFDAYAVDDEQTLKTIADIYANTGELLDPHTAIGVAAAKASKSVSPVVTLATAHPAKFPDAVEKATKMHPALPVHMGDLFERKERFDVLENSADAIKAYIEKTL